MIILLLGYLKPELIIAPLTLSLASLTVASTRPTMGKEGIPFEITTSTST